MASVDDGAGVAASKPIYIADDDDMSLFVAIRVDMKGLRLRVKVIQGTPERNVNSYCSGVVIGEIVLVGFWCS